MPSQAGSATGGPRRTVAELTAALITPDRSFSMIPMIRLNDRVERDELRHQLALIADAGMGGVYLYAEVMEGGLQQGYLSEEWHEITSWMFEEAAACGLDVWIYDEADWPSGQAGGKVWAEDETAGYAYVEVEVHPCDGPEILRVPAGDDVLAAVVHAPDDAGRVPMLVPVEDGVLVADVPAGPAELRIARVKQGVGWFTPRYTNLLSSQACESFCAATHDWYAERFPAEVASQVRGYFTDEPTVPPTMFRWGDRFPWAPALPWADELGDRFRRLKGYDVLPYVPLLVEHAAAVPRQVRLDFWDVVSDAYEQEYFARIRGRCDAQGVDMTGHLMSEEDLDRLLYLQGGDPLRLYRQFTIPGIDYITAFPHPEAELALIPGITPKLAASSAAVHGRARTMSESFAASGWGMTPDEARRIFDWQLVHGINMFVVISWKYSLRGFNRTVFYPPGIGHQQPYWQHFGAVSEYVTRLSSLGAAGDPVHHTAVVFPTTLLWDRFADEKALQAISGTFNALLEHLLDHGVDFCFVREDDVNGGSIVDGAIEIGAQRFESLVVPERCGYDEAAWVARLGALEAAGVAVSRPDLEADINTVIEEVTSLSAAGHPDVRVACDDPVSIRRHVRRGEDFTLAFLLNCGELDVSAVVEFPGSPGSVYVVDGDTGTLTPAARSVALPSGRLVAVLAVSPGAEVPLRHGARIGASLAAEPAVVVDLSTSSWSAEAVPTMSDPRVEWQFYGRDGSEQAALARRVATLRLGDWSQQDLAGYSGGVRYRTAFSAPEAGRGGRVWLDLGDVAVSAEVRLNGEPLGIRAWAPYTFDVTDAVVPGDDNVLEVVVYNTLANYYATVPDVAQLSVGQGGLVPARLRSGLIGPVRLVHTNG